VPQDGLQRLCTESDNKPPPALAKQLEADQMKTIVYPQGSLLGDWKNGERRRRLVVAFGAQPLQAVLRHAIHRRLAARPEVALQDGLDLDRIRSASRISCDYEHQKDEKALHRLVPGPRYGSPLPLTVRN
jgi:hypothetical protein